MEKRVVSHSAPYGHACMNCFKAKCRCIPRHDGDGCERCHRLQKQCVPSNSVRRRAVEHRQAPKTRVPASDRLVPQIQSQVNGEIDATIDSLHEGRVRTGPEGLEGLVGLETAIDSLFAVLNVISHTGPNTAGPSGSGSSPTICLDTFRSYMLPHFPFFHLPAKITAQQLHLSRPFLFRAITCVASPTSRERQMRSRELKRVLHELVFLGESREHENGAKSNQTDTGLDLLLGLLVYIAWGWDHRLNHRLVMLAVSMVGEMYHDDAGHSDADVLGLLDLENNSYTNPGYCPEPPVAENNVEYQRALLASFLLGCTVSTYSGVVNPLWWTPRLECALAAVSATRSQHDQVLALQIRLQLLATQALQLHQQGRQPDHGGAQALLTVLENLQPVIQQHQGSLHAHLYHAELAIHEALHASTPLQPAKTASIHRPPQRKTRDPSNRNQSNNPTASIDNDDAVRTPQYLWCSLSVSHACVDALLALPVTLFRGIAFPQWAHLARCLAALHHLEKEAPHSGPRSWPTSGRNTTEAAAVDGGGFPDLPALLVALEERLEGLGSDAGEIRSSFGTTGEGIGGVSGGEGTFRDLAAGLSRFREKVLRERDEGRVEPEDSVGYGGVCAAGEKGVEILPPQKGFFASQRWFWMDQIWTAN
ncbi:hypothetical protein C7999DRAFT_17458 [Corynascus novoguineensis]|uniref:Zn(2)-C6 fungal-type domain-containing protein n=1 Tax=Corynascus novoguineensis TaxID=1126955 RepID=A0AAN7CM28_9PEZI|nr:hypothetical protein C7999DRAFT_17458 [Corynascus novoguineensis]